MIGVGRRGRPTFTQGPMVGDGVADSVAVSVGDSVGAAVAVSVGSAVAVSVGSGSVVGIAVDGASAYGRGILRGAMQYIQVQRRWEIFSILRGTFDVPPMPWPPCDGAIIAGAHGDLNRSGIVAHQPHVGAAVRSAARPDRDLVARQGYRRTAGKVLLCHHLRDARRIGAEHSRAAVDPILRGCDLTRVAARGIVALPLGELL